MKMNAQSVFAKGFMVVESKTRSQNRDKRRKIPYLRVYIVPDAAVLDSHRFRVQNSTSFLKFNLHDLFSGTLNMPIVNFASQL